MTPVERVIETAKREIGYLEKASNKDLDDKVANAGSGNWTKYARDLDRLGVYNGKKNGYAWCDIFVDWCFIQTFGLELALKMTGQPKGGYGAGCTESASYYKRIARFFKDPEAGDQIFFSKNGGKTCYHTGLVTRVTSTMVYTIEGNTSSELGVVENGGAVRAKSYYRTASYIAGYGRPLYYLVPNEDVKEEEKPMTGAEILATLSDKEAYELLQKAQRHAASLPEPEWSKQEGYWAQMVRDGVLMGGEPERLLKRDELAAILGRNNLLQDS